MSALGHKRHLQRKSYVRFTPNSESEIPQTAMSALAPKADMCGALADVCFGPEADICAAKRNLRFSPDCDRKSRHHLIGRLLLSSATEEYDPYDANLGHPRAAIDCGVI